MCKYDQQSRFTYIIKYCIHKAKSIEFKLAASTRGMYGFNSKLRAEQRQSGRVFVYQCSQRVC